MLAGTIISGEITLSSEEAPATANVFVNQLQQNSVASEGEDVLANAPITKEYPKLTESSFTMFFCVCRELSEDITERTACEKGASTAHF